MNDIAIRLLTETVGQSAVLFDEPMKKHTTFKIGGCADMIIKPSNVNQLMTVIKLIKQFDLPYFVLGNGSNILVSDKGIRGIVIEISSEMAGYAVDGTRITAECGIKLGGLSNVALNANLSGLEFASGIPGTLGGALYMNAGAYGGEMKDIVESVTYFDVIKEEVVTIPCEKCEFGYRKSLFSKGDKIILSAVINLKEGSYEAIKGEMAELAKRRNEKQPVDKPSAGSTFKRPEGYFAGTLIQDTGLKGYRVGGAEVSEKHAGFVVNVGDATAEDVKTLIKDVQDKVYDKYGVMLEPEVRFIGEF